MRQLRNRAIEPEMYAGDWRAFKRRHRAIDAESFSDVFSEEIPYPTPRDSDDKYIEGPFAVIGQTQTANRSIVAQQRRDRRVEMNHNPSLPQPIRDALVVEFRQRYTRNINV